MEVEAESLFSGCSSFYIGCTIIGIFLGYLFNRSNFLYIIQHKVDTESTHHGGELVAQVLKSHGIKFVFTLVGGHISPILVAAEKLGLRVIDTRHEVTAVFAADAVARLSGVVGVAVVTAGPGVTNTITAVKNAQMAESPILIIGGAAAGILKGRGALQDIDQLALFQSLCKYSASVTCVRNIVPVLKTALQIAQSGTPGPVFVEIPLDVLYPYALVKKELFNVPQSKKLSGKLVSWYMNNYLSNLFAGAWEPQDCNPLKVDVVMPDPSIVQKCAEALSRAKKPVIVVGSQALLPPVPATDIRKALERLGVPCYLSGMARGLLGRHADFQMRHHRTDALREADLVILAGAICDFRLSYGRSLNKKATIIAVNRDKIQLYKNSGIFWSPSIGVVGDAGSFLVELSHNLLNFTCDPAWLETLRERDSKKDGNNLKMSLQSVEKYQNPMNLLMTLENILPENAILVADGGDFVATAAYILRPRGPLRWLDPGAFGTLGVGGGFALGAKLCCPDAEVWIIYGDGSCGYSLAEIDTFKRHNTPIISLVGNDACWTQISREQVPTFGTNVACQLLYGDYHKVAEGFGGKGLMVSDEKDMMKTFQDAQMMHQEGHSVLINALIGTTKFREGSISV